jgi:hypothetical protein
MYPKWTFPENKRKKPKSRKKRMGPATSESSIMCWSIRARGLRTANVYFIVNSSAVCYVKLRKQLENRTLL